MWTIVFYAGPTMSELEKGHEYKLDLNSVLEFIYTKAKIEAEKYAEAFPDGGYMCIVVQLDDKLSYPVAIHFSGKKNVWASAFSKMAGTNSTSVVSENDVMPLAVFYECVTNDNDPLAIEQNIRDAVREGILRFEELPDDFKTLEVAFGLLHGLCEKLEYDEDIVYNALKGLDYERLMLYCIEFGLHKSLVELLKGYNVCFKDDSLKEIVKEINAYCLSEFHDNVPDYALPKKVLKALGFDDIKPDPHVLGD